MRPPSIIVLILILLFLVLASNSHAETCAGTTGECADGMGHISNAVCDFVDADGSHYDIPAKCPGLCCQDCGEGCSAPVQPPPLTPTNAPERPILTIVDGEETKP